MLVATCFWPDGSQVKHRNGEPLVYFGGTEHRVLKTAKLAWWPGSNGRISKDYQSADPKLLLPPDGSVIKLGHGRIVKGQVVIDEPGPEPKLRFELVPVYGEGGEEAGPVIGTTRTWVDIGAIAEQERADADLELMRKQVAARRAAQAAERAASGLPGPGGSVGPLLRDPALGDPVKTVTGGGEVGEVASSPKRGNR